MVHRGMGILAREAAWRCLRSSPSSNNHYQIDRSARVRVQEAIFYFGVNLMQPQLGSVSFLVASRNLSLELHNPVFGRAQFLRQSLSFSIACRLLLSVMSATLPRSRKIVWTA
jgi:hypothetical protein